MSRKSVRDNKNIFQLCREQANMTRFQASEATFISESRIEKIEYETCNQPLPEEVLEMSKAYNRPDLCNIFCSSMCPIGIEYIPAVSIKDISSVTLEMLVMLNNLNKDKDRLAEIMVDGVISENEKKDFARISDNLEKMSLAIDSLKYWVKSNS